MLYSRLLIIVFILTGNNLYSQIPDNLKNTVWKQEGYDRVLEIEDSTYSYFNFNQYHCSALVEGKFGGRFKIIKNDDSHLILNPGGIVNYRFNKTLKLPEQCAEENKKKNDSFEINFKSFWETFNSNYAFFQKRDLDWQQVDNDYLPKVRQAKTKLEFALILKEITEKINDGHVRLEIPESVLNNHTKHKANRNLFTKDQILSGIEANYLKESKTYNNGVIRWGILKNRNIGYIGITDMNDFANYVPVQFQNTDKFDSIYNQKKYSKEPLEQFQDEIDGVNRIMKTILNDLDNTDAMIVDLRFNGGGYETVALKLLSYFVSQGKEIISIKARTEDGFTPVQKVFLNPEISDTKKTWLLISPFTASAAEIFALGSLSYSNIERVGSESAGIFSEILWKELPNGWEYSLSNEVYFDNKNISYEEDGIPVDYQLNYPTERSQFYNSFYSNNGFSDRAIEKIIEQDLRK